MFRNYNALAKAYTLIKDAPLSSWVLTPQITKRRCVDFTGSLFKKRNYIQASLLVN